MDGGPKTRGGWTKGDLKQEKWLKRRGPKIREVDGEERAKAKEGVERKRC